ncbi:MAG: SHOCT domain-containing protein [Nitrospirota bacterium]|nr:SHOCT domain-containing protein [Nitrospirota bacterium]
MRILIILSLLIGMSACAAPSHLQRIAYQEDDLLIVLDQQALSDVPGFEGRPYTHPANIPSAEMKKILESLKVGPQTGMLMSLFSKDELSPLFDAETTDRLSKQLSQALSNATPLEKINFYQMKTRDATHVAVTSGFILVKTGKLHLKVNQYNMPLRKGRHPSRAGLGLKQSEKGRYAFELLEGKQMAYRRYKNVLGLPGSDSHWLIIDYTDFPDPALQSPGTASSQDSAMTLEKRLRTLKHLRTEGLITEEEYSEKKQSLLKDF